MVLYDRQWTCSHWIARLCIKHTMSPAPSSMLQMACHRVPKSQWLTPETGITLYPFVKKSDMPWLLSYPGSLTGLRWLHKDSWPVMMCASNLLMPSSMTFTTHRNGASSGVWVSMQRSAVFMTISRSTPISKFYHLDNTVLEEVNACTYLGITTTGTMSWREHISTCAKKAILHWVSSGGTLEAPQDH